MTVSLVSESTPTLSTSAPAAPKSGGTHPGPLASYTGGYRFHRTFPVWAAACMRMPHAPQDFAALHSVEVFVREYYPKAKRIDEVRAAALFVVDVMRRHGLSPAMVVWAAHADLELPGWGPKRFGKLVGRFAEWMHAQGDLCDEELAHIGRDLEALREAGTIGSFPGGVRDVVLRPANPGGPERPVCAPPDPELPAFLNTLRNAQQRGRARCALEYAAGLFCHYIDSDTAPWAHFDASTFVEFAMQVQAQEPADGEDAEPCAAQEDGLELEQDSLRWLSLYVPWLAQKRGGGLATEVAESVRLDCLRVAATLDAPGAPHH